MLNRRHIRVKVLNFICFFHSSEKNKINLRLNLIKALIHPRPYFSIHQNSFRVMYYSKNKLDISILNLKENKLNKFF